MTPTLELGWLIRQTEIYNKFAVKDFTVNFRAILRETTTVEMDRHLPRESIVHIQSFIGLLIRSAQEIKTIAEILGSVSPALAEAWAGSVEVKNGRVASTYYATIADHLTHNKFVALYEALGYDFANFGIWRDYRCTGFACVRDKGYSCDTDACGFGKQ